MSKQEDVWKIVNELYLSHQKKLSEEIEQMASFTKFQQWIIYGRVVQMLFQAHFPMTYLSAKNALNEKERSSHTPPEGK